MRKIYTIAFFIFLSLLSFSSCKKFVFGAINVDEERGKIVKQKIPTTAADLYVPPKVQEDIPNPDPDGAFANWATCLIMMKEGHPHGEGKMHGNYVYPRAAWRQEEFGILHNTPQGVKLELRDSSILSYLELENGKTKADYFRLIGGNSRLWAMMLYFFDKNGRLLNDDIYKHSDQYQIFFSISDLNDKGEPYPVMDLRIRDKEDKSPRPSAYFADKNDFESRREATKHVFMYDYRDTWTHDDMGDGVRRLFNIRLLPPLSRKDMYDAFPIYDQDNVGLKGYFKFDVLQDLEVDKLNNSNWWPYDLSDGRKYDRRSFLLPQFYLAVRVMKCEKGMKALNDVPLDSEGDRESAVSTKVCAPFDKPNPLSKWVEIMRFNLPFKIYTNSFDTDPTHDDPFEPYYVHMANELGITPEEAFEAIRNTQVQSADGSGGSGFGTFYL